MRWMIAVVLFAAIVLVLLLAYAAGQLSAQRAGRWVLLGGLGLLPLVLSGAGAAVGVRQSSQTEFCLSCHEMEAHGKSLFVDNSSSLVAAHYQQRLIPRESTCYACHTDYALFGDFKAKLNGLKHVWVHAFGEAPQRLALYQPYPNYNCLHCHDDARGYLQVAAHQPLMAELRSGARSCLGCHSVAHDLEGVKAGNFWVTP